MHVIPENTNFLDCAHAGDDANDNVGNEGHNMIWYDIDRDDLGVV